MGGSRHQTVSFQADHDSRSRLFSMVKAKIEWGHSRRVDQWGLDRNSQAGLVWEFLGANPLGLATELEVKRKRTGANRDHLPPIVSLEPSQRNYLNEKIQKLPRFFGRLMAIELETDKRA